MSVRILQGDCRQLMRELPSESVHCCVTSPPYWGLRDYGLEPVAWDGGWLGSLGLEPTPELYVDHLVEVFREVHRVLRTDATLWLNIGDCYATGAGRVGDHPGGGRQGERWASSDNKVQRGIGPMTQPNRIPLPGLKPKDLVGIPWRLAFALRADGWWLRSDVVWAKPNPMPESVTDRPTKAHEYVFLLAKSKRYYFDQEAVRQPHEMTPQRRPHGHARRHPGPLLPKHKWPGMARDEPGIDGNPAGRNIRTVWSVATQPFPDAHFAVFPEGLIRPCVLAGTSERGCCSRCGAPWVRLSERAFVPQGDVSPAKLAKASSKALDPSNGWGATPRGTATSTTLGWRSSCGCVDSAPVRCTVLDPFAGSGTTGLVADQLGRDAVILELNPTYCEMARRRIERAAPLLADVRTH
jgi:DNA modification methylase